MALFQSTVTYRNRKAHAETYLLQTKRVTAIQAYNSVSEFYYNEGDKETNLYRTALTKDNLTALVTGATEFSNFVELPVLAKSTVKRNGLSDEDLFDSTTVINVNMDDLVKGWGIESTSTSYLYFKNGDKSILYKVNDTIADIESAGSTSVSIA